MIQVTEGIVLRQVKTVGGRRMILLFSRQYGKISCGTGLSEKGRGKSALALRPFTHGRYELHRVRDNCFIAGAQTIQSYYAFGEDVDKYMAASFVLELSEKLLVEDAPNPRYFQLLLDFFDLLQKRDRDMLTLVLVFETKALQILGVEPLTRHCAICGSPQELVGFHVREGGTICRSCMANLPQNANDSLICSENFDIVETLQYIMDNPVQSFRNLSLDEGKCRTLRELLKRYLACHLDLGSLKSESYI